MTIFVIQDDNRAEVLFTSTVYGEGGEETTNATLDHLIYTEGCWNVFGHNDSLTQLFGRYSRTGNAMSMKKLPGTHVKKFDDKLLALADR